MPPDQASQRDRAFLLRIWEERSDLPPYVTYRLSLEEVGMRTRQGFADLERLIAFLQRVIAEMRERAVGDALANEAGGERGPGGNQ